MKDIIKKWVLKNAYDFGNVNSKFVMGRCLREESRLKKDIPKLLQEIDKLAKEVSGLSKEELKKRLKEIAPELLKEEKKEKKEGLLKELPGAKKGKVVVRIAPSPSGPLHIGHAYGASLNYEYAKMYSGKFLVRIEDTNPENIYEPAYQLIEEDVGWLTEKGVSGVVVQSSRLGRYYDAAERLVSEGKAYVCECDPDQWRKMKGEGKACKCRGLPVKEQQIRYAKMFSGYGEGEAVLRLKTKIDDKNPAMRDFSIMRINEHVHPKVKGQRVWPLMVFSVAIDDQEMGVTHVLNGKDHADNAKKEGIIMEYLGGKPPVYKHWGRINFEGFKLSTSKVKLAIEQGIYTGWDDIRLATLRALRRRGYQAGALRRYAVEIGLSLNDKTVSQEEFWKNINAFNRELIEEKANRYFFVERPKRIKVEGFRGKDVSINLHPDFPKRGKRKLKAGKEFYISEKEMGLLKAGKVHRLMDCLNFKIEKGKFKFVSEGYEDYKKNKKRGMIIHWLPTSEKVKAEVLMGDGSVVSGYGEEGMEKLKEGELVQLERNYYARVDEVGKKGVKFWFLHK